MKFLRTILQFVFTHIRIKIPKIPGITLKFFFIETEEFRFDYVIGLSFYRGYIAIHCFLFSIELLRSAKRFSYTFSNEEDTIRINNARIQDYCYDTVLDEAEAFERRVQKKLKLEDHKVTVGAWGRFDIGSKFLYIEPYFAIQLDKIKLPKEYEGREIQRKTDIIIKLNTLPLAEKIGYLEYWTKEYGN